MVFIWHLSILIFFNIFFFLDVGNIAKEGGNQDKYHADGDVDVSCQIWNAFSEDVKASREAGLSDHASKPLDIKKLGEIIEKWLG